MIRAQIGRFPFKIALHLKKACYKVSLREIQRKSCKAFSQFSLAYLPIHAKMVSGGRTLCENLAEIDQRLQKRQFPINIRIHRS